jgi:thioredoxin reductase (NADPH)
MENKYDVCVIGSGPAGLTAAVYLARGAASTLILGGTIWGGQLMSTTRVDNFPGFPDGIEGPDLMEKMKAQAIRFGAEFLPVDVGSIDVKKTPFEITAGDKKYFARSVIIATGAKTLWLDVPGIKDFIGRGVSSCAPCDAPFFKDKKVAVIGGGDSAMEEADVLTKYASEVTIIHRRSEFKASAVMQEKVLKNPKIKVLWNTEIVRVNGKDKVESLDLKNGSLSQSQISNLPVDGLFVAIGHKPESEVFKGVVETDERGFIKITGGHSKTSIPGIFVAGDVMDPYYKQAITSAGSGCAAAMDILAYLSEEK